MNDENRMSEGKVKQPFNPWPYSIGGFFAVAILAAIGWVMFCIGHGTDLVAADYYEQEVEYQDQMNRVGRAQELSSQVAIAYDTELDRIRVQLPVAHAASHPQGSIHLYRPSEANLDQRVRLHTDDQGIQNLDAGQLKDGLWDIRLQWTVDGQEYFVSKRFTIARPNS